MSDFPFYFHSQNSTTLDFSYYITCGTISFDVPAHRHDFMELELIISGKGTAVINGVKYQLERGSLSILLPWHVHETIPDKKDPPKIFKCHFSLDFLEDKNNPLFGLNSLILENKTLPPFINLTPEDFEKIHALFAALQEEYEDEKDWKDALIKAKIAEIIIYFDRFRKTLLPDTAAPGNEEQNIWRIIEFIHMSFDKDITLGKVAGKFHIEEARLNELLKKNTGLYFGDLLQEVRIRNSCVYLSYPALSISAIANVTGYKSLEAFYRAFKLVKGISPENYRKHFKHTDPDKNVTTHTFINTRILYYMHLHFYEDITLSGMAQHFHYNENYLSEMLAQNGLSFVQLLHEIRIYHACSMLLTTDLPIHEIGFDVGFNSLETFNRVFKKMRGMSPREYRKTINN